MRKLFLTVSFILSLLLVSCDQLNRELSTGDIQVDFPGTSSRTIYSSTTNKEVILTKPENAIFRLYLIDEKGFTVTSTVGKPGGTAVFNNIKEGLYTLKCYYGLSATKINAVAAATKLVTVVAGETSHVDLELTYNRSNLIEKVNVEWAGDDVYYGDPDDLDDYILDNTLIDFYLSNGWNESFLATDTAIKSFCHIENDLIDISMEHIDDTSFRVNIKFHYRKTPDSEILNASKTIIITVIDDPSICYDWNTLTSRISSVSAGESATFKLINANYTADTQLSIPADTNIAITTDSIDVVIQPMNSSMDHLFYVNNNSTLTLEGGAKKLTLDGRYSEHYTFTGALIQVDMGGILNIQNNVLIKNAATNSTIEAGAIAIKQSSKCTISNNVTFDSIYSVSETLSMGGAISNAGELTITGSNDKNVLFTNCNSASSNDSTGGGAIFSYGDKLSITNATFKENVSFNKGGAIFINSGTNNKISNCSFTNNEAMNGDNDIHTEDGAECTIE